MLELVAAYGNFYFHCRPSEVRKKKRTNYRKRAMRFSICWQAVFCLFRFFHFYLSFPFFKTNFGFRFFNHQNLSCKIVFSIKIFEKLIYFNWQASCSQSSEASLYSNKFPVTFSQFHLVHFK